MVDDGRHVIYRFHNRKSAELIAGYMAKLTDARIHVRTVAVSERDVGDHAVCWFPDKPTTAMADYRLSRCADEALKLALADALADYDPQHYLIAGTWHLRSENRDKVAKFYIDR